MNDRDEVRGIRIKTEPPRDQAPERRPPWGERQWLRAALYVLLFLFAGFWIFGTGERGDKIFAFLAILITLSALACSARG